MKARPAVAETIQPDAAPDLGARELRVVIRPYKLDFWEYHGTRAQLEAEGVIPANTEWPERSQSLYWDDGRLRWSLCRTRPEGLKGPMKLWTSGDWWNLRCDRLNLDHATQRILTKRRELAKELYRQSAAGQREWDLSWSRYWEAHQDKAFQAFKSLFVPARKKPGRNPKVATPAALQGDCDVSDARGSAAGRAPS